MSESAKTEPTGWALTQRFFEASQGMMSLLGIFGALGAAVGVYFQLQTSVEVMQVTLDAQISALTVQITELRSSGLRGRVLGNEKDIEYIRASLESQRQELRELRNAGRGRR